MSLWEEVRAVLRAFRPARTYWCDDDSMLCSRCLYAKSRHTGKEMRCPPR